MTDRPRPSILLLALAGAAIALTAHRAPAAAAAPDTTLSPRSAGGLKAKGYMSARYAYVGSSSAATAYSGMRMTGSFQLSALSDRIVLKYRSNHWLSFERPEKHVLESAFANRNILQTVSIETDGLIARRLKTGLGRFLPEMDYGGSRVIDGGALSYELGGFSVGGAAGRTVDPWNGDEKSSDILAAGQVRYRTKRVRASAGFQSASYLGVKQREVPAGINVMLNGTAWLEAYAGYDFRFKEFSRAGLGLSWRGDGGGFGIAASQWRNPFDQIYLADKGKNIAYWGLYSGAVPSTYTDVRVSGSYGRGAWGVRGTIGSMAGVRAGWTASGSFMPPSFLGFRASAGGQGMKTDYIEFYSLDAALATQVRNVFLQLQSQTRNYSWRPRPSGFHDTDTYAEISAEYPLRAHLYLNAAAGGFFRTLGNEGFKPQAELRLTARI